MSAHDWMMLAAGFLAGGIAVLDVADRCYQQLPPVHGKKGRKGLRVTQVYNIAFRLAFTWIVVFAQAFVAAVVWHISFGNINGLSSFQLAGVVGLIASTFTWKHLLTGHLITVSKDAKSSAEAIHVGVSSATEKVWRMFDAVLDEKINTLQGPRRPSRPVQSSLTFAFPKPVGPLARTATDGNSTANADLTKEG